MFKLTMRELPVEVSDTTKHVVKEMTDRYLAKLAAVVQEAVNNPWKAHYLTFTVKTGDADQDEFNRLDLSSTTITVVVSDGTNYVARQYYTDDISSISIDDVLALVSSLQA